MGMDMNGNEIKGIIEKPIDIMSMDEIDTTRQYCQDNCILSGCNPKVINAALHYLKNYRTPNHINQDTASKEYGISSVALRNNVHKIQQSEHLEQIRAMLGNDKIGTRC